MWGSTKRSIGFNRKMYNSEVGIGFNLIFVVNVDENMLFEYII